MTPSLSHPSPPSAWRLPRHRVWLLAIMLALLSCPAAFAQVQSGRELVRLGNQAVHDIAINSNVTTTIFFPEKVTLLTGFGLVTAPSNNNQQASAKVCQVHYENTPSDTLVVRLIKPGDPCYATIRTARSIYLMRFTPSDAANLAVIVPSPQPPSAASQVESEVIAQRRIQYSSEELVGMLGKARNRERRGLKSLAYPRKGFYYLGGLTEASETLACFALMCWQPAWFPVLAFGFAALCGITLLTRLVAGWQAFGLEEGSPQ